ncbi:MAG: serine/threonine protein kinase, partial [Nocardiopsaceae bacterium]|nr:serine/threonine protein kinase [Nocardiopsaceae bacterium]
MPELPAVGPLLPAGTDLAGYRILGVLGRGTTSVVYQAGNPRLGNVIALKVLDPELAADDASRTRFLEESRIAAALNHPHVIPIHDMGAADGLLYIAMRQVAGTDLRRLLGEAGRLPPSRAVALLVQAARALDAAHRKGLVHRDVKPGNLLVEEGAEGADGEPGHVYLTDFGITKVSSARTGLTSPGEFVGTVDYIAPEQIRGISVTGLADQYSLGCVLYHCLTGRLPFSKDADAAVIFAHVQERPPPPSSVCPDLPEALDAVLARALAKQPGDRYPCCRELMEAAAGALAAGDDGAATGDVASISDGRQAARSVRDNARGDRPAPADP